MKITSVAECFRVAARHSSKSGECGEYVEIDFG
jgi:hypothetical protein